MWKSNGSSPAQNQGAGVSKGTINPKSWTDVLKGNQSIGEPISLEYIQPTEEIQISEDEWVEGAQIWKFPVVFMVANAKPSYMEMMRWISVNWARFSPKLSQIRSGVFLVEFQSDDDRLEVLCKHWTFYHNFSIVLKPWNPDKELDQQGLDSTPVWVQLPGLSARLWTSRNLSKIVCYIGKPLAIDRLTSQRTRLEYARVLVDIDVQAAHLEEIPIRRANGDLIN